MEGRLNFKCWNIEPLKAVNALDEDLLKNIVEWAILSPSSHNIQCWKFRVDSKNKSISIMLPKEGILGASDVVGRQAYVSLGCALQNILVAAEYYGLKTNTQILGQNFYPDPVIALRLEGVPQINAQRVSWLNAIKNRRANRGKFNPLLAVPEKSILEMQKFASSMNLKLHAIKDTPTRFAIAEVQYLADKFVIAKDNFRLELSDFFLENNTQKSVGMPGNTFGLSDEMTRKIKDALSKTGAFDPDLSQGFSSSGRDGIKSSPVICVLSAPRDDYSNWIKVGEALTHSLLIAEMNGLSSAMHAAIVEVEFFNKMLRLRLGDAYRPTAIFRIGYKTEDRPHSPRKSVDEVIEYI